MKGVAAISTELAAAAPAMDALVEGGTALDAVLAGFLGAAAERPDVLFAPLQILVAGPGVGARAFDGRVRQPGAGAPRPRGFVRGSAIPDTAYAGVPASLAAIAVAHAHDGSLSIAKLCAPAISAARRRGADARASMLARFARLGASALTDSVVARALVAAAGRVVGGLLTEEDLAAVRPATEAPREILADGSRRIIVPSWQSLLGAPGRRCEIIAAGDRRKVLAVLCYTPDEGGVRVPELGVSLTRDAVPVMRGIPRTSPGTPCPAPKPLAILLEEVAALVAIGARADVTPADDAWAAIAAQDAVGGMLEELVRATSRAEAEVPSTAVSVVAGRGRNEMTAFGSQG